MLLGVDCEAADLRLETGAPGLLLLQLFGGCGGVEVLCAVLVTVVVGLLRGYPVVAPLATRVELCGVVVSVSVTTTDRLHRVVVHTRGLREHVIRCSSNVTPCPTPRRS